MKKSQLRKIIKESIKELMTEQTNPCANTTNTNCNATCYTCIDGEIIEQVAGVYWTDDNYPTSAQPATCGDTSYNALPNPWNSYNFTPGNTLQTAPGAIMWVNDVNWYGFASLGCSVSGTGTSSDPCATSNNPNCGSTCYACIDGIIYEEDPNYATSPGGGWTTSYSNSDVCGYGHIGAFGSNTPPQPFDPSNSSLYQNQAIWWNSDTNADFTYFGCSYPTPYTSTGNTTGGGGVNFDPTTAGGQQNADYLNLQIADPITPTPNPNDPQMKRMKDLAFRGKGKR